MDTIDGIDVLAFAEGAEVQLREIATGAPFASPIPTPSLPEALDFGRIDGREVLLTSHFATVRVWDPRSGRLISELPFGTAIAGVTCLPTPDGGLIAAVGGPGVAVTEIRGGPSRA